VINLPISRLFATLKKKFNDKSPPPSPVEEETEEDEIQLPPGMNKNHFRDQLNDLRYWAEHRVSTIEEETEDSGGTLKIEYVY
jgi:hypothetical protein